MARRPAKSPFATGAGGGKSGSGTRAPREAANTLRSKAVGKFLDVLSEGPIGGLVNGAQSIYLNDTPLQNPDGTYNFQGVNVSLMAGLPDQGALPGFPNVATQVAVGVQVKNSTGPVVRHISTVPLSAIKVTINVPVLYSQDKTHGDLNPWTVEIKIEVQADAGAWQELVHDWIGGKCMSAYQRQYRIVLPPATTGWNVRVTRLTGDYDDDTSFQGQTWWAAYSEILDWSLSYPDTAYSCMQVDSELFGNSIPTRSYDIKGLRIKVPSNYNPVTRAYTGLWDGTFVVAWTDNPAWVFYDLLTNARYGLGSVIPESRVDKWSLYTIAQYCDGLVPNGYGGSEPRFTFNGVINNLDDAYVHLQTIAGCFRGMAYWGAGVVTATQDSPLTGPPAKLVTNANVIDGVFSYEGTSLKARHTVARVVFADSADAYRPAFELVDDAPGLARWGIRPIDVQGVGITSRTQARRIGRWILDSEKHETETVSYRAGLDHADLRPGEIIAVQDGWYNGLRFGGRVRSATTTSMTPDHAVEVVPGFTYLLRMTLPDGTIAERQLSNMPGSAAVLTWDTPLIALPQVDSVWQVSIPDARAGTNTAAARLFRVIAVVESDVATFQVTALFHDSTKFDRIEQGMNRAPPTFVALPTGLLMPPTALAIREFLFLFGGTTQSGFTASWEHSTDPRVITYQLQGQLPGATTWQDLGESPSSSIDVQGTKGGTLALRVRAVDGLGRTSAWSEQDGFTLLGLSQVPDDVTAFKASTSGDLYRLSWNAVRQNACCSYRIRYNASVTGVSWEAAVDIATAVYNTQADVPRRDGTYLIKAVTSTGVESATAALLINASSGLLPLNNVESLTQEPSWAGTLTNTVVAGGGLVLATGHNTGTYVFASPDLGGLYSCRLNAAIQAAGITHADYMSEWVTLSAVTALASGASTNWSLALEFRSTTVDPALNTWGAWTAFQVTDVEARAFQFRVSLATLDGGVTMPAVTGLTVSIDMPDRVEAANNVSVPSGGLAISFGNGFRATPAIAITGQSLATGDYWLVSGQSEAGFTVRFFNAAGTGVARTMDWIAKGFGRQV